MFEIVRYTPADQALWNAFTARSKNGTFLFDRRFMDYHSDRFTDSSLICRRKGRVYALLPANRCGDTLYSHQGLTYGGLIVDSKATTEATLELFRALNIWLREAGIHRVVYKALPWIYHRLPAEEDLYALTQVCHARLVAREISSTILLQHPLRFTESRKSGLRKALREGLYYKESDDMAAFWQMLDDNLTARHHTHPVHTLAELQLLHGRFPDQIRLFLVFNPAGTPVGGTLVFDKGQVIHTQYIASTYEGKAHGALDLLFDGLIHKQYAQRTYLDFGKSTEQGGQLLNAPLIFQKEGFGGRGVCYDTYEWEV